jgi:hypothetical protein
VKNLLALLILFGDVGLAQTPPTLAPEELGNLVAQTIAPLVAQYAKECDSRRVRVPFYYGGDAVFKLPTDVTRCLHLVPPDSFPNRNPYQDGFVGKIIVVNLVEAQDSVARVWATYFVFRGPPELRNFGHGFFVDFRRRNRRWVEVERAAGIT